MDPLTIIVSALGGAAVALGKKAADEVVRVAYDGLKSLVLDRCKSKGDVENAMNNLQAKPQSQGRQATLKEELELAKADGDAEVLQQATALLGILNRKGLLLGTSYQAIIKGSGAVAQGPGAAAAGAGGVAVAGDIHGSVYVGAAPQDDNEAMAIYHRVFAASFRHLPLRGMDLGTSDPMSGQKPLDLDHVYVNLDTKIWEASVSDKEKQKRREPRDIERVELRVVSVLEAIAQYVRVLILGDPGSGKSTFLNHLGLCLALNQLEPEHDWVQRLVGWPKAGADLIPMTVTLRDFAKTLPEKADKAEPHHLWEFIVKRFKAQKLDFAINPIEKALERGKAIVLLDGLDEIPSKIHRKFVRDAVTAFADRYAKSRLVVTCRTLSYQDPDVQLTNTPTVELAPFDGKKIDHFINAWYTELEGVGVVKPTESESMRRELREAVRWPDLWRLAPNPLLLTVMALVHTHKGRLPDARALLYEDTVDILLWRWEQIKAGGEGEGPQLRRLLQEAGRTDVDLKRVLWRLAFEAHQQAGGTDTEGLADIGELSLIKKLRELHPTQSGDWAYKLVEAIKLRAGLLLERAPELYTFPHRTFQEYLAGAHLAAQAGFAGQVAKLVEEGAFWREVILLAVGRLVYLSGDIDKPLAMVAELCPHNQKETEVAWRKVWLAADALKEIGQNRTQDSELGKDLWQRVQHRLVELIRRSGLTPRERAEAGNTLADLGDPRFRSDAWFLPKEPLLGFVEIPKGPFQMGTQKNDISKLMKKFGGSKEWFEHESPQQEMTLPTYYISRYPVTVQQFQNFVEHSGHEVRDRDTPKGIGNHPMVNVTWYDAMAYCDWLTKTIREWGEAPEPLATLLRKGVAGGTPWVITLPGEAEWEKVARGPDARNFPWGDEPDANRANYDQTGIGTTSAVGCFLGGASPYGVEEMSGNVWEWTRSLYEKYPYPEDEKGRAKRENRKSKGSRVLRGGAFDFTDDFMRCAYRNDSHPDYRYRNLGFRVVASPFLL